MGTMRQGTVKPQAAANRDLQGQPGETVATAATSASRWPILWWELTSKRVAATAATAAPVVTAGRAEPAAWVERRSMVIRKEMAVPVAMAGLAAMRRKA